MRISIQINPQDLDQIRHLPWLVNEVLQRSTYQIAARTAAQVQPLAPHATGQLARSIRPIRTATGADVLMDTAYAQAVHDGRKAGYRSDLEDLSDLSAWMRVKGIPESALYPIARQLQRFGTKPVPFLREYVDSLAFEVMARNIVTKELANALG
ncbi:hypothetical protein [Thiolinea disciformis]|uniref:hypothetical protein n=1 Tax=Thiolinea disciformis TaxID=125614 RepID=UPI0003764EB9|nr:hypothetical protein [Thiolinea disciformis]